MYFKVKEIFIILTLIASMLDNLHLWEPLKTSLPRPPNSRPITIRKSAAKLERLWE